MFDVNCYSRFSDPAKAATMMNQSSASGGDADNLYSRDDRNLNNITTIETIEMSQSGCFMFEGFNDNDDEVFEELQESTSVTIRGPRVRRISDVIDSIGCSPSSPVSKGSNNFDFSETTETTEERSISIVRREEVKYIELQSPPRGDYSISINRSLIFTQFEIHFFKIQYCMIFNIFVITDYN